MSRQVIKADSRGGADYGWLKTRHSFSFADYYDPERVSFGLLRVLNDDTVEAGRGFDTHPHSNMEIITIPLEGDLVHRDSIGNERIIRQGDIQVMSAGTGIRHSEYNANSDRRVRFLQIWIYPYENELKPRYDQKRITMTSENELITVLSPQPAPGGVWINQQAWISMGSFTVDTEISYSTKKSGNGVYIFIIKGDLEIGDEKLSDRDAIAIKDEPDFVLNPLAGSELLLLDIPMRK